MCDQSRLGSAWALESSLAVNRKLRIQGFFIQTENAQVDLRFRWGTSRFVGFAMAAHLLIPTMQGTDSLESAIERGKHLRTSEEKSRWLTEAKSVS